MITKRHTIEVHGVSVEVVRKDIKNLHLGVYPPKGRVRVAAPLRIDDEGVRLAVISRLAWIRQQRQSFDSQDRQSEREMVTGESHYYKGRRFRLNVIETDTKPGIVLRNNTTMELRVRPGANRQSRERLLDRWYRDQLRERLPFLLAKWEPIVGITVSQIGIKKMKTRWGTCNIDARRIWLNLELVKKPPTCLEYILAHEMIHFLERHHNDRFRDLIDKAMPDWRVRRSELNRSPLAHENWSY